MNQQSVQSRINAIIRGSDPTIATVAAVLLAIVGLLVIIYPMLIAWVVGIALILAAVAMLASIYNGNGRADR